MPSVRRASSVLFWLSGLLLVPLPAFAAATDTAKMEGVELRLVAERPGEDGRFRAALLIDLEPGWKTYWLDPGEAGIPPSLDFSGSGGVENVDTHFPPPHRFDDGFSKSIVYSEPMAIAIDGRAAGADESLDVKLTLGICRDICIPASAELKSDLGSAEAMPAAVSAAFAALPRPSTETQGITGARLESGGDTLVVTVAPASNAAKGTDLFVSAPKGWSFGPPSWTSTDRSGGSAWIALPVASKPRKSAAAEPFAIDAILVGREGSWRAGGLAVERKP